VVTVGYLSAHRDHPYDSFHTRGDAIDIRFVETAEGRFTLEDDFLRTEAHRTCNGEAAAAIGRWGEGATAVDRPFYREARRVAALRAQYLLRLACLVSDSNRFNTVITPNYNDGHRDHFHFDARPYDNRLFTR
jgi:hypothetical protein